MRFRTILTFVIIVGFIVFLTWSTLSAQKVTCDVCVRFNGADNCASASHENEQEAAMSARTTACGPLARGMNDAIACQNRAVISQRCRTK